MLDDELRQPLERQPPVADRPHQLGSDRVALDAAMILAGQHVGPPLQPHFAGQRLADLVADARDLDVEGMDRQHRPAVHARQKQRRGVARKVVGAHEIGTESGGVLVGHQGTAIRAAATRRRSPSMML